MKIPGDSEIFPAVPPDHATVEMMGDEEPSNAVLNRARQIVAYRWDLAHLPRYIVRGYRLVRVYPRDVLRDAIDEAKKRFQQERRDARR